MAGQREDFGFDPSKCSVCLDRVWPSHRWGDRGGSQDAALHCLWRGLRSVISMQKQTHTSNVQAVPMEMAPDVNTPVSQMGRPRPQRRTARVSGRLGTNMTEFRGHLYPSSRELFTWSFIHSCSSLINSQETPLWVQPSATSCGHVGEHISAITQRGVQCGSQKVNAKPQQEAHAHDLGGQRGPSYGAHGRCPG